MSYFSFDFSLNKILIIEDSKEYVYLVKQALGDSDHHKYVDNLKEASKLIRSDEFECVVLDLSLPDGSGIDFLSKNKDYCESFVVLSSSTELSNKVMTFGMGAVDYVEKPFDRLEFSARVHARLVSSKNSQKNFNLGNLNIDIEKRSLKMVDFNRELELTPKEFDALLSFVKNKGNVLSRQRLLDLVWGESTFVNERSVDSTVAALRRKVSRWSYELQSVYGVGYKLVEKKEDFIDEELVALFETESEIQILELEKSIRTFRLEESLRLVHKLKGSFSIFTDKLNSLADEIYSLSCGNQSFLEELNEFLYLAKIERFKVLDKFSYQKAA